jgi:hypothetical protein
VCDDSRESFALILTPAPSFRSSHVATARLRAWMDPRAARVQSTSANEQPCSQRVIPPCERAVMIHSWLPRRAVRQRGQKRGFYAMDTSMFMFALVDLGSKFARWKGREGELARLIEAGPAETTGSHEVAAEAAPAEPETVSGAAAPAESEAVSEASARGEQEAAHEAATPEAATDAAAPRPEPEAVDEAAAEPQPEAISEAAAAPQPDASEMATDAAPIETEEPAAERQVEESGVTNQIPEAETA